MGLCVEHCLVAEMMSGTAVMACGVDETSQRKRMG
jgi:hypothetical protein